MRRKGAWIFLTVAGALLGRAATAQTLREALQRRGVVAGQIEIEGRELEAKINGTDLIDEKAFAIAYRILEGAADAPRLGEDFFLRILDRSTGAWSGGRIPLANLEGPGGICGNFDGSPIHLRKSRDFFFVEFHRGPSCAATLALTRDLAVRGSFCGWILAISPEETVVYRESVPHAAVHPTRISLYSPRTALRRGIFPPARSGRLLLACLERAGRAREVIGSNWFRASNLPEEPEASGGELMHFPGGPIAIDDASHTLAFVLSFGDRGAEGGLPPRSPAVTPLPASTRILFLFRGILSPEDPKQEEHLLPDLRERFPGKSDEEILKMMVKGKA